MSSRHENVTNERLSPTRAAPQRVLWWLTLAACTLILAACATPAPPSPTDTPPTAPPGDTPTDAAPTGIVSVTPSETATTESATSTPDGGEQDHTVTMWTPTLEWSLENDSYEGNPYDLEAETRFEHVESGETITTPMFYAGDDTWKFRFTGTRLGEWTYATESPDDDLDGETGTILVEPNPDPDVEGFLVAAGTQFAVQVGNEGELEAFLFNVFQDERLPYDAPGSIFGEGVLSFAEPEYLDPYLDEARSMGFDVVFFAPVDDEVWTEDGNPREETFVALETIIREAHSRGMRVQFWKWGDAFRGQTPPGGINSEEDRRLQRTIAARLAPLPGWTMSYGFDLEEWVGEEEIREWAEYMHEHMGWDHLLIARRRSNEALDVVSNDERPWRGFYQIAVEWMEEYPDRPHYFERRFWYERDGVWDMSTTRRAIWQFTMAGGAGSLWGHYENNPYPEPHQFLTYNLFWEDRFLLGMERAPQLSDDSMALLSEDGGRAVFYQETTSRISMDLSGMPEALPAVAVDTVSPYEEIDLGMLDPEQQVWEAPYASDWAIAVGDFD